MRQRETTLSFAEDDACLTGHFPGNPVVPAVAILTALIDWAEGVLGRKVVGVQSARFRRSLLPGIEWRVTLEEMEPDTAVLTGKEQDRVAMNLRLRIAPPQSGQGER
jgi:3-hydroxymyristoyl/3-hydroxydecanoyl-(acyl carrier protein) dehydratase